jgi:hypothetical protein
MLSLLRISQLRLIGHVNSMDCNSKVSQVFNNNPQGSRLRGRPYNRWLNCVQTDINKCKITNWKDKSKTELTISSLSRRRPALDCSAIKEIIIII